jgi:hypothetical protein
MQLEVIQNKIFEIRGCKVMLDFDLALMYGVETKVLNNPSEEILIDFLRILCLNLMNLNLKV